jgi:hypothetical protein
MGQIHGVLCILGDKHRKRGVSLFMTEVQEILCLAICKKVQKTYILTFMRQVQEIRQSQWGLRNS